MIDLAPLLRHVAFEHGDAAADYLAEFVRHAEDHAREMAARVVRRPDLTGVVASAFLSVGLIAAADHAERNAPDEQDASPYRLFAYAAAADAWQTLLAWADRNPGTTAGDGLGHDMG